MSKASNVRLKSNVYPVEVSNGRIDFFKNPVFVSKVWMREALIKLIQCTVSGLGTLGVNELSIYAKDISGIREWQIRRILTPDACAFCEPGEKPWGIIIKEDGDLRETCRCPREECASFSEYHTEDPNGFKK